MSESIKKTMQELESLLTIVNIEGVSSTCYVIDEPDFCDSNVTTILEVCDNFGGYDCIDIRR